jgi:hypothetical protein
VSDHYSYRVVFSHKDGGWVGLCTEFPSLPHLAPTHVAAMQGVAALVAAVVEDMKAAGKSNRAA